MGSFDGVRSVYRLGSFLGGVQVNLQDLFKSKSTEAGRHELLLLLLVNLIDLGDFAANHRKLPRKCKKIQHDR